MWKCKLNYIYDWHKVVNVVCLDAKNPKVTALCANLSLKGIEHDICVIDTSIKENSWYDGRVELVLLGSEDLFDLRNNQYASIIPQQAAIDFVRMQDKYQLIDSGVDFAAASRLREMWLYSKLFSSAMRSRTANTKKDSYYNQEEFATLYGTNIMIQTTKKYYEKRAKEIFALYC